MHACYTCGCAGGVCLSRRLFTTPAALPIPARMDRGCRSGEEVPTPRTAGVRPSRYLARGKHPGALGDSPPALADTRRPVRRQLSLSLSSCRSSPAAAAFSCRDSAHAAGVVSCMS